jgi:hypothetical protein
MIVLDLLMDAQRIYWTLSKLHVSCIFSLYILMCRLYTPYVILDPHKIRV